jgi:hypothetical protein
MQGKSQCHGKEGEEQFDIIDEFIETASLYTFIGKPITNEKDDSTYNKEAGYLKYPSQMAE